MPLLDKVKEMQQQGLNEGEIAKTLESHGFSPVEINQALEQSKIKAAVYEPMPFPQQETETGEEMEPSVMETPQQEAETGEEMEPSVMETPQQEAETGEETAETPQYIYPTPQPYYSGYEAYEAYQATSPETMTDIAEQVSEEKINKIRKDIKELKELKTIAESKIKNIDDRLKKIEDVIDRLQATILGKIGSYGQNMQDIKKEMGMMQESFSKALPSLIEKDKSRKTKKKSTAIDSYLTR